MRRLIAVLCGLTIFVSTVTPVSAQEVHSKGEVSVPVTFEQDSIFTAILPEGVTEANGANSAEFNYSVKGDIASDKHVTIDIEDENTSVDGIQIKLHDVLSNEKEATIAIDKTSFAYNEITGDGVTCNGSVSFTGLTAGNWTGSAKFIIGLD